MSLRKGFTVLLPVIVGPDAKRRNVASKARIKVPNFSAKITIFCTPSSESNQLKNSDNKERIDLQKNAKK